MSSTGARKAAAKPLVFFLWKGVRMLVLSRRPGEKIVIKGPCEIVVLAAKPNGNCRIGIIADKSVKVVREELLKEKKPA